APSTREIWSPRRSDDLRDDRPLPPREDSTPREMGSFDLRLTGREIHRGVRKASRCDESMGSPGEIGSVACLDPKVIPANSGDSAVRMAVFRSHVASINRWAFSRSFAGV